MPNGLGHENSVLIKAKYCLTRTKRVREKEIDWTEAEGQRECAYTVENEPNSQAPDTVCRDERTAQIAHFEFIKKGKEKDDATVNVRLML